MIKIIFLCFAYVSISNALIVNRTNYINWLDVRTSVNFQGVNVQQIKNGYKIDWLEEFNGRVNPLMVYLNYIFEETGSREIVNVGNLCGRFKPGSLEFAVQKHVLLQFSSTKKCPIKKDTNVIIRVPDTYTWQTENQECGFVDGSVYIVKRNPRLQYTPLLLRIHYTGYVTGSNCAK